MNLFIIGNGFDLAHGLKTSYEDFRIYLRQTYPDAGEEEFIMPEVYTAPNGAEEIEDEVAVSFMMRLISATAGGRWRDVETTLGLLDYGECFEGIPYARDLEGDIHRWRQVYQNEDIALNLTLPTQRILQYFADWVGNIDNYNQIPKKDGLLRLINRSEDLFLTFNYTETLQQVYGARNVCHIHGKQGGKILFGHGNEVDYSEEFMDTYIGAENVLCEIQDSLRKDTEGAFRAHSWFFDKIDSRVQRVYTYGFSFSEVDSLYIKKICGRLTNPNVVWYLSVYDGLARQCEHKQLLRKCGYRGGFDTYSIG